MRPSGVDAEASREGHIGVPWVDGLDWVGLGLIGVGDPPFDEGEVHMLLPPSTDGLPDQGIGLA